MRKVNGRRTPSDGKSSHCLWQGELKKKNFWRKRIGTRNYKSKYKSHFFVSMYNSLHFVFVTRKLLYLFFFS
jgi:hypothetical protein